MATLENLLSQAIVERLGWTLIHFVWQAAAIALLLAIVLKALHKHSASLRYIVACLALMLIVALPLVTMALVEVSEPVAEAGPAPAPMPIVEATPVEVIEVAELPAMPFDGQRVEMADMAVRVPWTQRAATALEPALPWLVLSWLLGVFGLSAWHLGGWTQLQRMKQRMVCDVAAPLRTQLAALSERLGVARAVGLLESALVEVPTLVGWIKPVILLPASALSGLSTEQLEAILAHELAHVRRCDYLVNIVQTVVEILGFYHPALWWISHKIRTERENCCDDLAVQVCGDSVRYARALTCLEEMRHHHSELAVAASGGSLVARIGRLLGRPTTDERRFTWLPGLIALLLVAFIVIPAALVLAAPEPIAADTPTSELPGADEVEIDEPPRTQLLIRFIIADVFSDQVMDRETAEKARDLLRPISNRTPPNLEELQRPLGQMFSEFTAALGKSEELIDLLVSRGRAEVVRSPVILQFEDERGLITDGDVHDPNAPDSQEMERTWGFYSMSLNVTPHVGNTDTIRMEIDFDCRYPTVDQNMKPGVASVAMQSVLTTRDGQDALLTSRDERRDKDGTNRLCVLLVRPEITVRANENKPAEQPKAATVLTAKEAPETASGSKGEARILIDCMFAKVLTNAVLDHETMLLIGDILAGELTGLSSESNVTLGEILQAYVVGKPLTPATIEALVDLLEPRGYLKRESRPQVLVFNNRQAQISVGTEEPILPAEDSTSSPEYIELGTFVQATPHLSPLTSDRITLEIAVQWIERAQQVEASDTPAFRTTEIASTVIMPRDRFFSLLIEPDNAGSEPAANPEFKLIMFRADSIETAAQQEHSSVPQAQQSESHPRQVLLDFRTVVIEQGDLADLGIEWGENSGFREWQGGVQIGYMPDKTFTDSVQAALGRLAEQGRAQLLARQQVVALDGRQARVRAVTEEWYTLQPQATADQPKPQTERMSVASGTILSATPRIADNNDITLELATEVSNSIPQSPGEGLPIVTRRKARNVVTVRDGGTVALAGLSMQNADPGKQIVILVTAHIIPENEHLPQTEPAALVPPSSVRVIPEEPSGQTRFVHTDVDGQVDREFGFEELVHSEGNRWAVANPYMNLFLAETDCRITADRGEVQLETAASLPAPNDATFSDNVVVNITASEPNSAEACVLYLDDLTFAAEKGCLSSGGPVRFVSGGTEFVGRGLELFCSQAPDPPEGTLVKTINGIDLYLAPSGSFVIRFDHREANAVQVEARFLHVGAELMDALQQGLPAKGVAVDEETEALHALGKEMSEEQWITLDEVQTRFLLRAIQSNAESKSLAAPRVTVWAGESTQMRLADEVSYTAGYDEPNEQSGKPIPRRETIRPGLTLEIAPSLISEDQIALDGSVTLTRLEGFEERTYRNAHTYQVPLLDEREVPIDDVRLDNGQTALLLGPTEKWPGAKEAQPLLILIRATKTQVNEGESEMQFMPTDLNHLPGGFGGQPTQLKPARD